MIRHMYRVNETPDERYLELDDKNVDIICSPPEEGNENCVKCIDCKFGIPVFLGEHLIDGFEKRVVKLSEKRYQKNLYRVDECSFTKEVRRCALCNKKNTYFTLNSTCEHAALDKMKKAEEEKKTEASRIKAKIERARRITIL